MVKNTSTSKTAVTNGAKKIEPSSEPIKKQEQKSEDVFFSFDQEPDTNIPSTATSNAPKVNDEIDDLFANVNINQIEPVPNLPLEIGSQNNSISNINILGDLMTPQVQSNTKIDKNSILALYGSNSKPQTPLMTPSPSFQQIKPQQFQQNQNFMSHSTTQNSNFQYSPAQTNQFANFMPTKPSHFPSQSNQTGQNNATNSLDLFSFDAFSKPNPPSQTLPNIGNTLSSDLWHM